VAVVGVPFAPDGSPAQGSVDVFGFPENFVVTGADAGGAPQVDLFDTGTGSHAVGLFAYTPLFPGGARVAIADVTGDGVPDVVTGAGPGGGPHVRVFDGVTGAQVSGVNGSFYAYAPEFRGGVYVAAGDLDGDGRADIVTGAGSGGGPHVRVFSGATGAQLPPPIGSFFAYAATFTGGVRVAVGDVDGDGVPDIITAPGPGMTATVRVFSGTTARLVREFTAFDPGFRGGAFVAAGDVDGDGRADIVAGADAGGGPHVRVFSGATGLQLPGVIGSFFAYSPAFAGGVRVAAADINGDGRADIITGAGPGGGPHVRVFDGASGAELPTPLGSFFAYAPTFSGGVFVAGPPFGVLARMVIDLPSSRATLRQPFVVAGWALDAASPVDTGIDTIHVWAYPISSPSQAPIFLGVAEYGLARPDVAAIFGTRDTRVGYTLTANGLAAGSYTIVVYAHSSRTHTFASARTVTITVQ
jgi:hypothetical protein